MCAQLLELDPKPSILRHITMLKPWIPRHGIVSIGEYSSQILLKKTADNDAMFLFLEKTTPKSPKFRQTDPANLLGISQKAETHYWFNVQQALAADSAIVEKLKSRASEKLDDAIMVASVGEGVASAFLPELTVQFREWNVDAVAFSVLPSAAQPPDAYFNMLYALASGSGKDLTQILLDRDNLEGYVGVDRRGVVLNGNSILNYILSLTLEKERFVSEICELSRSFNAKFFTVLAATGASLKIHGTLQNILNTTLLRPFLNAPLTDASVLYVLVRLPTTLKDKLPKGKIELTIVNWFKDKATLKSVYVSEPLYVNDGSDRLDIVMFVGGFSLDEKVAAAEKKVKDIKTYAKKAGFIEEKEWQKLIESLTA
jgi:hypothetical protein